MIRHHADLCFTDSALRTDAGEALGSIEPGQRFRGRRRIVHRYVSTPISNVNQQLRVAGRLAEAGTRPAVNRITRLADRGIRRVRSHPYLIVHGGVRAFRQADEAARRAGLRAC